MTPEQPSPPMSFALRSGPLDDESMDSWIHWLARSLHSSPTSVLRALGVTSTGAAGALNRDLERDQIQRIAEVIGVERETIENATLSRWDRLGLRPARDRRGSPAGLWQRGSGARYCASCLQHNTGRWPLVWYLHWSYMCLEHQTLLHSTCSTCTRTPRSQKLRANDLNRANYLDLNCGCGATVNTADQAALPAGHIVTTAQRRVCNLLADPGVPAQVGGVSITQLEWFADMSILVHYIGLSMLSGDTNDALTLSKHVLDIGDLDELNLADERMRLRDDLGRTKTITPQIAMKRLVTSAALVAGCVAMADRILASDCLEDLRLDTFWMRPTWRLAVQQRAAHGQIICSEPLLDALTGHVRQTKVNWLSTIRSRHRSTSFPDVSTHHLPAAIHPRARRTLVHIRGDLQQAAVITGLIASSRHPNVVQTVACELALAHLAGEVADTWDQIVRNPSTRRDVETTAGWLFNPCYRTHPVNFHARRRALPEPLPLPQQTTDELAAELKTRRTAAFASAAAMFVWERLTGSDALLNPYALSTYGAFKVRYRHVRRRWNECTPIALHRHLLEWHFGEQGVRPAHTTNTSCWHATSHHDIHLVPTYLDGRPCPEPSKLPALTSGRLGDALTGMDAVQIAQAVRADPHAQGWGNLKLLWQLGIRDPKSDAPPWMDGALEGFSSLTGMPRGGGDGDDPCLDLLGRVLTILRTGEVPHDCPYERTPT